MVTWDWTRKIGSCRWYLLNGKTTNVNIYVGNCLAVFILEYKDKETKKEMYRFLSFFDDEKHLKNCLGLSKENKDDIMKDMIKSIKLNTYYKDAINIAKLFARANHKVTLYYKEPKEKKNKK